MLSLSSPALELQLLKPACPRASVPGPEKPPQEVCTQQPERSRSPQPEKSPGGSEDPAKHKWIKVFKKKKYWHVKDVSIYINPHNGGPEMNLTEFYVFCLATKGNLRHITSNYPLFFLLISNMISTDSKSPYFNCYV